MVHWPKGGVLCESVTSALLCGAGPHPPLHDTYEHQVIILNAKSKKKEQFWWDYLKLNIFLSDLEYYFGYYILMNRWQIPMIQRWIAEYREKGFFESQRAKDYLLFYLKAGEKTPVRVLNSQGVQVKMKMPSR